MNKVLFPAVMLLMAAVSCTPVIYSFNVDKSFPSLSGLDMSGKTVSIVYSYPDRSRDSSLIAETAMGMASGMEKNYFSGENAIPVYNRKFVEGVAERPAKDSLVNLVVDTGCDVVFYFYGPETGNMSMEDRKVEVPFSLSMAVYDSMNKADSVQFYDFNDDFIWAVSEGVTEEVAAGEMDSAIPAAAFTYGKAISTRFTPEWKTVSFVMYLYDSDSQWMEAAFMAVENMDWKGALEIWMAKADTGNMQKRSCAAYNCALACHMLGDNGLAAKWLDYSDSVFRLANTKSLRTAIGL